VLAKELTKVFERFIRGASLEVLHMMQANTDWHRGEFVLLLDKAAAVEEDAQA
jgi:16S rRNA C1402 (ribose-2'-O) methylase RsmI